MKQDPIPILETLPSGPLGLKHCIPWSEYLEEVLRPEDVHSELWTNKVNSQNKTKQKKESTCLRRPSSVSYSKASSSMTFDTGSGGILSGGNKLPDKAHKFLPRVLVRCCTTCQVFSTWILVPYGLFCVLFVSFVSLL